ncbi:1-phosphatidylinositol 4,5-bisphosphate phosphodiesterase classes I and II [Eumeta japonica]|uniref:1-phosphatidylinositol 4,5-bisphosphate phosphodiesterase classes I and II n=1 Tax=Eumeta variegata TaxID=151549 RepID=A0A4C1S9A1_EUMVA|nr:1-phosphatidylinositol 4,5-bisphosphate phosphodiesterase classes I and II [Eumeta japonica]
MTDFERVTASTESSSNEAFTGVSGGSGTTRCRPVVLPELASIRIAAHEDNGRLIGHRILPVSGLCPGYRHVSLRTELGLPLPLPATLFLLVVVKDYVPDKLSELAEALANPIKYQSELDKREHQLSVLTEDTDVPDEVPKYPPKSITATKQDGNLSVDNCSTRPLSAVMDTSELLKSEASNAIPPVMAAQPKIQEKDDPNTQKNKETKENGSSEDLTTESLETFLSCKSVRDKYAERERKLDALHRKQEKERKQISGPKPNVTKIMRRLPSYKALEASCSSTAEVLEREHVAQERDLRLRYHHEIYAAIEKHVRHAQQAQMKELTESLEVKKKEILNELANRRKEGVKALSKKPNRDKEEILRIKREIHSQTVERGVAECSRLEEGYARRREALAREHERVRALLQKRRDQDLLELEAKCGGAPEG